MVNKALPGPNKEIVQGLTEHGGVLKVTYFFDSKYKSVPRDEATRAIVHEYDEKNRSIYRDYLVMGDEPFEETDYDQPLKSAVAINAERSRQRAAEQRRQSNARGGQQRRRQSKQAESQPEEALKTRQRQRREGQRQEQKSRQGGPKQEQRAPAKEERLRGDQRARDGIRADGPKPKRARRPKRPDGARPQQDGNSAPPATRKAPPDNEA